LFLAFFTGAFAMTGKEAEEDVDFGLNGFERRFLMLFSESAFDSVFIT
jgi:hypothetical protein